MDVWRVSVSEKAKYDRKFSLLTNLNYLTEKKAKDFLSAKGVSEEVQKKIWELADVTSDGLLDRKEFSVAMVLRKRMNQGYLLPDVLPASLLLEPIMNLSTADEMRSQYSNHPPPSEGSTLTLSQSGTNERKGTPQKGHSKHGAAAFVHPGDENSEKVTRSFHMLVRRYMILKKEKTKVDEDSLNAAQKADTFVVVGRGEMRKRIEIEPEKQMKESSKEEEKIEANSKETKKALIYSEAECIECGFCLRRNEFMEEPKILPCGHAHCQGCLEGSKAVRGVLTCPDCDVMLNHRPDSLPKAPVSSSAFDQYCDTCARKGKKAVSAVVYCTDTKCCEKYCHKHRKHHDELMEGHELIQIAAYARDYIKHQKMFCSLHKSSPLTNLGCRVCQQPLCLCCLNESTGCAGKSHWPTTLKIMKKAVKEKAEELEKRVAKRQEELSELSKWCDKVINDYEEETERLIKTIDETRGSQILEINNQYEELKENFIEARLTPRNQMAEFRETQIEPKLIDLTFSLKSLIATLQHGHEAEIAKTYSETEAVIESTLKEGCPALIVTEPVVELKNKGTQRELELEIAPSKFPLRIDRQEKTTPSAATALYNFTALNDDELTFREGDIIRITCKKTEDSGWWSGELNGRAGLVPANHLLIF
ncbi:intersectin-2-like [Watersipora subatra]|uniref:intersectin-2-like n=1 Tax=Watersipora subatra TaxID=2589382 RepID=UPI00355C4900